MKTQLLPLRSRTIRGKPYNIIVFEEPSNWGQVKCREKCLTVPLSHLTVMIIQESRKPCPRLLWTSVHCLILDKVEVIPYNVVYQKERYRRPIPMAIEQLSKPMESLVELGFTKREINRLIKVSGGVRGFHTISIPKDLYRKLV